MSNPIDDILSGISKELKGTTNLEKYERAQNDKFWFAREVMGNEPVFPTSLTEEEAGDWVKLFNYIFDFAKPGGIVDGVLNSPRNSLKTTLLICRIVDLIANDRNIRIYYAAVTQRLALAMSRAIQHQLAHNKKLHEIYGTFEPTGSKQSDARGDDDDANWRQDFWTVSGRTKFVKEPTFTAGSAGKSATGDHYDVVIIDDAVDNTNTMTAESILSTIDWFKLVRSLRDKKSRYGPGGCMLDVGTRYADGDLHGWLLGEVPDDKTSLHKRFKPLVLRAMENPECWDPEGGEFVNPVCNFPHILPKERLDDERSNGPFVFSMQYQNECIPPDEAHFRPEWFKTIPAYDLPQELRYYIFTDFAFGLDDTNDRTAIWVVGLDWERKAYCVDFDVGRWSLYERCRRVVALAQKYDVVKVSVEQMALNEGIVSTMDKIRDEMRVKFIIQQVSGRTTESKMLRIVSMQSRFERGRIFFVLRDNQDMIGIRRDFLPLLPNGRPNASGEILREFVRFPRATHDDIPDALSDIDKKDQNTQTYLFPGSPRGFAPPSQLRGPTLVNGRVIMTEDWGVGYGRPQIAQPQKAKGDFWSRRADRLRETRRRF